MQENLWPNIWGSLQVPPNIIPFSDFKAHVFFYQCTEIGIDINNQDCIMKIKVKDFRQLAESLLFENSINEVSYSPEYDSTISDKNSTKGKKLF